MGNYILEYYMRQCVNEAKLSLTIKMKVSGAVVVPTLLYACDSWTVYLTHKYELVGNATSRLINSSD